MSSTFDPTQPGPDVPDQDIPELDELPQSIFGDTFSPASSWLAWECTVRRLTDHRWVRHKPLIGTVTTFPPGVDSFGKAMPVMEYASDPTPGWSASVGDVFQQVASPSMLVQLIGFGVRLSYRVSPPKIVLFNGVIAVLKHEDVSEKQLAVSSSVIMYRTDWTLTYLVQTAPSASPLPANPMLGTDGQ